ncbi:hypothetical protein [Simkania sp.]|uniref:hypothetical protein n=1 Tax=Simkania sp. TaxID=34094 RepID=UPI003B51AD1D
MTSHTHGVSGRELHLISAQSQNDRAMVAANKSENPLIVVVVKQALKEVMEEILLDPKQQENFNELLMEKTVDIISDIPDAKTRKTLLGQVAKIGEAVMRYNVIQTKGVDVRLPLRKRPEHFVFYDTGEKVPQCVVKFDREAKHTIPLSAYLDARISGPIQELILDRKTPIDLFVGPIDDMQSYYFHSKGQFELKYTLNTRSSTKYFLFEDQKGNQKVVIAGISNESKFTHTLLQLKAVGVDLDKRVSVRGNIEFCARVLQDKLYDKFQAAVGEKPIALAVMGNRSGMVLEVAERLYPEQMKGPFLTADAREEVAVGLLKEYNNYKEANIDGIFKFSTIDVEISGETQTLVSFRMPNGDLSRIATRLILDKHEVGGFVMVGAGGSLKKGSPVGSYQVTTTSQLAGRKPVAIDEERVMPLSFCQRDFCSLSNTNVTVLSPLVETAEWLDDVRERVQSVDVETYFIMEALSTALKAESCKTMVIPGVFISDEVGGDHPLTEKIDPKNAWVQLPMLLKQSLTHFDVKDRRPKVEEVVEDIPEVIDRQPDRNAVVTTTDSTPREDTGWSIGSVLKTVAIGSLIFAGGVFVGKMLSKAK